MNQNSKNINKRWWKESVVYQIYPRSFNDTNNDGVGDIPGVIEKLDYIQSLGIDIIWMCPVYQSPNDDNGYDISDYRNIMEEFGTMDDFDKLLSGVHERGMKLIMDLVANHSSDEHNWFEESRKSKDNPYRDYYFWKPGKNGGPPTNWPAFFGGNSWEYDEQTGEYYLHLFTKKQPDLNWENPKVRQEIQDIIRFWFEKGVDGFRMDVISLISKQLDFPEPDTQNLGDVIGKYYANGPRIHEFLNEMNKEVLSKYDIMTVGEGPGINLDNGPLYVAEDRQELDMIFHFDHMFIDNGPGGKYDNPHRYDFIKFKKVFSDWDGRLANNGWGSIFLGNHDFSRIVSRFGNDKEFHTQSAKLLATMLLSMRGTPYVYQGDEVGMTNVAFPSIDDYHDVETLGNWKEAKDAGEDMDAFMKKVHQQSRDNARTPIQWNNELNGGFSDARPWLKVNPNYENINVASQENDTDSILNFYRQMIQFRKDHQTLVYGDFEDLTPNHPDLYVYRRWDEDHTYLVLLNFSENEHTYDAVDGKADLLIGNYTDKEDTFFLRPWESKVFQLS
ncbi:MAG: alpha,alpha-phosphotrehalase [Bacteroidota bacterium]